jgi:hypothetical protein
MQEAVEGDCRTFEALVFQLIAKKFDSVVCCIVTRREQITVAAISHPGS